MIYSAEFLCSRHFHLWGTANRVSESHVTSRHWRCIVRLAFVRDFVFLATVTAAGLVGCTGFEFCLVDRLRLRHDLLDEADEDTYEHDESDDDASYGHLAATLAGRLDLVECPESEVHPGKCPETTD
jgi:hypothetical protein